MTSSIPNERVGEGASAPSLAVSMTAITKTFGVLKACDEVSFSMDAGRIHGVLGQNGAGKSTLMKILIGLVTPDSGEIRIGDQPVTITSPQQAADLGIGMVHQHFSLVDALTVWENVILGEGGMRLDRKRARQLVGEIGDQYGLAIDPDATVGNLSAGQRQRIEIIKCLRRNPKILIFDEPTSVLTPDESEMLFRVLRQVVQLEGRTVALVSHKLEEVLHATDDVVIMRDGKLVASMQTSGTKPEELARAMVGREVKLRGTTPSSAPAVSVAKTGTPGLKISGLSVSSRKEGVELNDLSLEVHPGEIVGVAGVEGNGQRVLADVLSSLRSFNAGTIEVNGVPVKEGGAGAMAHVGIAVIPEDRHDSGCVLNMSVAENLVLAGLEKVSHRGVVEADTVRENAEKLIAEFGISCQSPDAPMWTLSGGNQQRVVLARELSADPKVLVAAQPTRGLDVGAIEYMGDRLRLAADQGVAVLLISSELEEILHLADRIVVMYRGAIIGEMPNKDVDLERLGMLMGGAQ